VCYVVTDTTVPTQTEATLSIVSSGRIPLVQMFLVPVVKIVPQALIVKTPLWGKQHVVVVTIEKPNWRNVCPTLKGTVVVARCLLVLKRSMVKKEHAVIAKKITSALQDRNSVVPGGNTRLQRSQFAQPLIPESTKREIVVKALTCPTLEQAVSCLCVDNAPWGGTRVPLEAMIVIYVHWDNIANIMKPKMCLFIFIVQMETWACSRASPGIFVTKKELLLEQILLVNVPKGTCVPYMNAAT